MSNINFKFVGYEEGPTSSYDFAYAKGMGYFDLAWFDDAGNPINNPMAYLTAAGEEGHLLSGGAYAIGAMLEHLIADPDGGASYIHRYQVLDPQQTSVATAALGAASMSVQLIEVQIEDMSQSSVSYDALGNAADYADTASFGESGPADPVQSGEWPVILSNFGDLLGGGSQQPPQYDQQAAGASITRYQNTQAYLQRTAVATTQIVHPQFGGQHVIDDSGVDTIYGSYIPSGPDSVVVEDGSEVPQRYKPFPAEGMMSQYRQNLIDQNESRPSVALPMLMDALEATIARDKDKDGRVFFDAADEVKQSHVDYNGTGRKTLEVLEDLKVVENVDVDGNVEVGASLVVGQDADIGGGLMVDGNVQIDHHAYIGNSLHVAGNVDLESSNASEPDLRIKHGSDVVFSINSTGSGVDVNITGDLDVGGNVTIGDGNLIVGGTQVMVGAAALTTTDGLIHLNVDEGGASQERTKDQGIRFHGAESMSERDFAMIVDEANGVFSFVKETNVGDWADQADLEDHIGDPLAAQGYSVAAEVHCGPLLTRGSLTVDGDASLGLRQSGGYVMDINTTDGAETVDILGDHKVHGRLVVYGDLDASGGANITGPLDITGKLQAAHESDIDGQGNSGYRLTVDTGAAGFTSAPNGNGFDLTGTAHALVEGDLQSRDLRVAGAQEVEGKLQVWGNAAFADVDLSGTLTARSDASIDGDLRINDDGAGGHILTVSSTDQGAGNGIRIDMSTRLLDESGPGASAAMTLNAGDMAVGGDCAISQDLLLGGDLWIGKQLRSESTFLLEDGHIETANANGMVDNTGAALTLSGYCIASDATEITEFIANNPEAIADVDDGSGGTEKRISILKAISNLVSGGSIRRRELDIPGFIGGAMNNGVFTSADVTFPDAIHDGDPTQDQAFKLSGKIKVFLNGQRLSADDFVCKQGEPTKLTFGFPLEEKDRLIVDVLDSNPTA